MSIIGDKNIFAIEYSFFEETRDTEIAMYMNNCNILEFEKEGRSLTTRWNLDEIALWLRGFLDDMKEDPYPVDCEGEYAAQKEDNARDFDSDDDEEFDSYYDRIDEWNKYHRWHHASSGAVLADVYFQLVGDCVEISWDNRDMGEGIRFKNEIGGGRIPAQLFYSVIDEFLKKYALQWF